MGGGDRDGLRRAAARRLSAGDRFLSAIQANVETAFARLLESAIVVVPRALAAALVLLLFWALAAAVRRLIRAVFSRIVSDLTVENLIKQVAYYTVWALGLIVAAGAFGLEFETVVTGLGLTSLAFGFALKDILSNFVSGLLILILRPFELGDQIVIGDTEGTVERINLRATEIRTYDGRVVSVPNAETFTSRVTNNTAAPVRRGSVECFVGYEADLDKVLEVLRITAQETEGVLPGPRASARYGPWERRMSAWRSGSGPTPGDRTSCRPLPGCDRGYLTHWSARRSACPTACCASPGRTNASDRFMKR